MPLPGAEHKRKFRNKFAKARLGKNKCGLYLEDKNEHISLFIEQVIFYYGL